MADLYWKLIGSLESDQPTPLTEEILKNEPDIDASDEHGKSLLHYLIEANNVNLVELIINIRKDINLNKVGETTYCHCTPLLKSIEMDSTEIAKMLITAGANVDICDNSKETPLSTSIRNGNNELAKILINSGADVNCRSSSNNTPLHEAVDRHNIQIATALLDCKANVNAQNSRGQTPLMVLSCSTITCYYSSIKYMLDLLLSNGADVNIFDNNQQSPLNWFALYCKEAVQKILNYKPRFDGKDIGGYSTIFIFFQELLNEDIILQAIEQGCCVKQKDPCGSSVLHYAINVDYKRVAYKLLGDGFDVNCCDNAQNTALLKASMDNVEISCMLLYYGAHPNFLSSDNTSSLLNAIRVGNHNLVDLLFLSYEGLNGDDCHKVVYTILQNPLANRLDMPTVAAMLEKFESFIGNNKVEFNRYMYTRKPQYNEHNETVEHFVDLSMKIKNFSLMDYMSIDSLYYYNFLVTRELQDPDANSNKLALFWSSLAVGISCTQLDFYKCTLVDKILFSQELLALIWGSFHRQLLYLNYRWTSYGDRFEHYLNLLHCDIQSSPGRDFRFTMIKSVFIEEYNRYESSDIKTAKKLFRILSFFSNSYFEKCTIKYSRQNPKRHLYELPNHVKTLAEISRDKARVFIMEKFKTKNFYQVHEIVNNFDIPYRVKRFLQLRIPVNCKNCKVMWCNCDIDEVAMSLENMYQVGT